MSTIGDNVKQLRERSGMSIVQLSKLSGVGKSTICELENGTSQCPKYLTLQKIAKALNASMENLTGVENKPGYIMTDISKAFEAVLNEENLYLNGEKLCDEARVQISNSIKMALSFVNEINKYNKK